MISGHFHATNGNVELPIGKHVAFSLAVPYQGSADPPFSGNRSSGHEGCRCSMVTGKC